MSAGLMGGGVPFPGDFWVEFMIPAPAGHSIMSADYLGMYLDVRPVSERVLTEEELEAMAAAEVDRAALLPERKKTHHAA